MATFRVFKESGNFVTVHKEFITDDSLSWKAKGMLLYLLSRPDDWQVYEIELQKHASDGRDGVRSGMKELQDAGYIHRERTRDEKGHFKEYEYRVYERPTYVGNSHLGKTHLGNSYLGKSDTTNNDLTNNDLTNNDSRVVHIPYKQIIEHLNRKTGKKFSHKSKANQKLIKARFNEGYTVDDFIKVIDNKVAEWSNVEHMKQYLQPSTLFSNKFDKYLNQESVEQHGNVLEQLMVEADSNAYEQARSY